MAGGSRPGKQRQGAVEGTILMGMLVACNLSGISIPSFTPVHTLTPTLTLGEPLTLTLSEPFDPTEGVVQWR